MTWHVPILLRVLIAAVLFPIAQKKITGLGSRTRRFRLMFLYSWGFAAIYALLVGGPFDPATGSLICLLGFVVSFGTYCYWRAVAVSLSTTALTMQADDIFGMLLGYIFLSELQYLNSFTLVIGILLALGAVFLYLMSKRTYSDGKRKDGVPFVVWVMGYSFIWGGAFFMIRFLALREVPMQTFLVSWYTGSIIGSSVILKIAGKKEAGEPLPIIEHFWSVVLAALIVIALGLQFWVAGLAPITVFQPIYQVTEMIFPALLGLYLFKELKVLTRVGTLAFVLGGIGMLMIMFSF